MSRQIFFSEIQVFHPKFFISGFLLYLFYGKRSLHAIPNRAQVSRLDSYLFLLSINTVSYVCTSKCWCFSRFMQFSMSDCLRKVLCKSSMYKICNFMEWYYTKAFSQSPSPVPCQPSLAFRGFGLNSPTPSGPPCREYFGATSASSVTFIY